MPTYLLAFVLLLAACTPSGDEDSAEVLPFASPVNAPAPDGSGLPVADDMEARAEAAGLNDDQLAYLTYLDFPVLVPVLPDGWALIDFSTELDGAAVYELSYRNEHEQCFEITGTTEGLGGPGYPKNERAVAVDALRSYSVHRMYWVTDNPDDVEIWGPGTVVTDYLSADGMTMTFASRAGEGCAPLSPDVAEFLINDLRFLDPSHDRTETFRVLEGASVAQDGVPNDPEALARAEFGAEYTTQDGVTVDVLRKNPSNAVILVTNFGLFDDSIKDERIRAVYVNWGDDWGGWQLVEAASQVRCHEGRGHTDWSPEYCQ